MISRRIIGALVTVTFALTTVLCACGPSFAATGGENATSSSAHAGCHGGKASDEGPSGSPQSHEHERDCQHCNHAQLLETRGGGQALAAPSLPFVSLPSFIVVSAPTVVSGRPLPRSYAARAASLATYLLNRVFLI